MENQKKSCLTFVFFGRGTISLCSGLTFATVIALFCIALVGKGFMLQRCSSCLWCCSSCLWHCSSCCGVALHACGISLCSTALLFCRGIALQATFFSPLFILWCVSSCRSVGDCVGIFLCATALAIALCILPLHFLGRGTGGFVSRRAAMFFFVPL